MRGRGGRKSIAALSIQTVDESVPRPDAPYDLTDEQAAEWWAVVNRMPADWFQRENYPLLTQYCRHITSARRIAQTIDGMETEIKAQIDSGLPRLETVLSATKILDCYYKMQDREGRAISSLATRMRLTQQSTYDKTKKTTTIAALPWE